MQVLVITFQNFIGSCVQLVGGKEGGGDLAALSSATAGKKKLITKMPE